MPARLVVRLTPLRFLERSAKVWADRPAVRSGDRTWTTPSTTSACGGSRGALRASSASRAGDRVAALLPNVAAMLELHYAVPGIGGGARPAQHAPGRGRVRLHPRPLAAPRVLVAYRRCRRRSTPRSRSSATTRRACLGRGGRRGPEYERLLADAEPIDLERPDDERALLSINYTSGTTGRPKGVMTTHRGAYLHALGVIAEAGLTRAARYLWTLPMFHCNGWAYTWAVTATGAKHVCLPKVDPGRSGARCSRRASPTCARRRRCSSRSSAPRRPSRWPSRSGSSSAARRRRRRCSRGPPRSTST